MATRRQVEQLQEAYNEATDVIEGVKPKKIEKVKTPRTLKLTNLWDNTKKFTEIHAKELKNASHDQVKTIYKNLWKEHLSEATEAGVDRAAAWKAFQKEKGVLLIADQTGEYGAAKAFKARFTDNFQYTTETSVTAQSRQWFDDFLSQATDGTPFTTTDGRNLYLNEFDQQFKELHHIHGISEGGVVAKPSIIAYINGNTAKAQAEFRTASHVWREQGLILGSKVENMQALTNYQHLGKDVGGHAQVGKQFRDTAIQEGKGKNKQIINAPRVIEEGAKEVKGRTLVTGSGESGLKFMPEMLNKVQTLPGDTLKYTTPKLVDGQMKSVYKGPFGVDPNVYTRFHAYGDIVILTDEGRKDRLFDVMLPDSPAVKPGTLQTAINPKKVKAQQNKLNLLLKKGVITEDQYKQMGGVDNLVRRLKTPLVNAADIARAKLAEQAVKELGGEISGKTLRNLAVPAIVTGLVWNDLKQNIKASALKPTDLGQHARTLLNTAELGFEGSQAAMLALSPAMAATPMYKAAEVGSLTAGLAPLAPEVWKNRKALARKETWQNLGADAVQGMDYLWKNKAELGKQVLGWAAESTVDFLTGMDEESKELLANIDNKRIIESINAKGREKAVETTNQSSELLKPRESTEDPEEGVKNFE